jgi:hypothetical protein
MKVSVLFLTIFFALAVSTFAADNLKINPKLDYNSDSEDGPLITGDKLDAGFVRGKPAYVLMYGEACFNSKRQARRTIELYDKYKGRVQFVIVDLDRPLSPVQEELKKKYYAGYIPHVVVLDASGNALYNSSGEIDSGQISNLLNQALH